MKPLLWAFVAGSMVIMSSIPANAASARKDSVNVIAHRGASAYAPENTLASYRRAMEMGADWFELDCTLSKDGAVVVIHDDDVERTTDGTGKVAELTLAELKALDAGSWFSPDFAGERLPTLAEALDLAKGKTGVYIEIKNSADDMKLIMDIAAMAGDQSKPFSKKQWAAVMDKISASGSRNLELTRKVIELIRERGMQKEVVVQSFSPIVCAVSIHEAEDLRTEFLGAEDRDKPERWGQYLQWSSWLEVKGNNISNDSATEDRIKAFHKEKRTVAIWTVDSPAAVKCYAGWGADSIITNKPDMCIEALRAMSKR